MKTPLIGCWGTALLLGTWIASTGCVQKAASSQDQTNSPGSNSLAAVAEAPKPGVTETNAPAEEPAVKPEVDIAEAAYKPLDNPKTVPSSVRTNGPVGEIIRMAESGVEEAVLLAFVTNSTSTFSLDADEIIYLNDIGVPPAVVTAMIQQDQALRATAAGITNVWSEPAPTETAQTPADIAPQATTPQTSAQEPPPPAEGAQSVPQEGQPSVTYNTFYNTLSPYGNWVYIEGYGNVWQPAAVVSNPDWAPYVNGGRWLYTDAGWYWLSDYSWGWAPFHYGRWFRHYRLGWCWYPDYVWGPSWVTWRYTDGYCGWAPLPPGAWWRPGIGLTFWGTHVGVGFTFGLGYNHYCFVSWNNFHHHHGLHHHRIHHDHSRRVYYDSVVATRIHGTRDRVINDGLPVARVEKAIGKPVRPVSIQARNNLTARNVRAERYDADRNTVTVFKPAGSRPNREPGAGGVAMSQSTARSSRSTISTADRTRATTTSSAAANPRSIATSRLAANGASTSAGAATSSRTWERPVPANSRTPPRPTLQTTRSDTAPRNTPATSTRPGRELPNVPATPESVTEVAKSTTAASVRSPYAVSPPQSRQAGVPARPNTRERDNSITPATRTTAPNPNPGTTAQTAPGTPNRTAPATVWQRGQPQLQARTETAPAPVRSPSTVQRQAPTANTAAPQSIWQRPNTPTQPASPRTQSDSVSRSPVTTRATTPNPTYTPPTRSASPPSYQAPSYQAPGYQAPATRVETPRYSAPTPSYQAPTRTAPSQPSYSPPAPSTSYSPPARSAPAAPSYTPPPSSSRSSGDSSGGGGLSASGPNRQSR